MLEKFFYYATTFAEAGLAVFGITGPFEQPPYQPRASLGPALEIREYAPTAAVETTVGSAAEEDTAFRLLFNYITGGNTAETTIAMTSPVSAGPAAGAGYTMRFFLPSKLVANPPPPADPRVHVVKLPATTVASLRFSGNPTLAARGQAEADLMNGLKASAWHPVGQPYFLAYNPPFTIPFLKRNEMAVAVSANSR